MIRRMAVAVLAACVVAYVWPVSAQVLPGSPFGGGSGGGSFNGGAITTPLLLPDGTANAPSWAWSSDADGTGTGAYRRAANVITLSNGGAALFEVAAGAVRLAGSTPAQLVWTSGALGTSTDTGLTRNAAGVIRATDSSSAIRGFLGGGAAVASATAMPVPTGRVFHVTGTTDITSITSTNFESGACITLIFDDVLTFTDGNNLVLAGNLTTTAADTISLCFDGTNWYETGRSVN